MLEKIGRPWRLGPLLGLGLLGLSVPLHAASNAPAADSVRPSAQSLGRLRAAYEQAIREQRRAPAVPALPLPAGFTATKGPNVLSARMVQLAATAARAPPFSAAASV